MTTEELKATCEKLLEAREKATPGEAEFYRLSGFLTFGDHIVSQNWDKFEESFANPIGNGEFTALAVNSASDIARALLIAIETLEIISDTDISDRAPDLRWLQDWRNETKASARETLAQMGEKK